MTRTVLTSVAAAALIAAAGLASAQDMKQNLPGAAAPGAAPQAAPAEKIGEPLRPSTQRPGSAAQTAPNGKPATNAQAPKADTRPSTSAQTPAANPKSNTNKSDTNRSDTKTSTDTKASGSTTTGQGAASTRGSVNLSTEQRTKITTVIKEQKVAPVTNVNFSISIGTRIPASVRHYPLPATVIAVYPAWRGYHYILVGDEILVIDPGTMEIVAVLEA